MINNLHDNMLPFKEPMICIDPGSAGSGIAFFRRNENIPYHTQIIDTAGKDWMATCTSNLKMLKMAIGAYQDTSIQQITEVSVFIEEPQYFESYTGRTSAKSGSLAKLVFFYGRLWEMINTHFTKNIYAVPIQQWKGQMDKAKVNYRILKAIGKTYESHSADAVGIGLYLRGVL